MNLLIWIGKNGAYLVPEEITDLESQAFIEWLNSIEPVSNQEDSQSWQQDCEKHIKRISGLR